MNLLTLLTFALLLSSQSTTLCLAKKSKEDGPPLQFLERHIDFTADPKSKIVSCTLLKRRFFIQTRPDWAPKGAKHFLRLIKDNYFDKNKIFHTNDAFISFGISGDEKKRQRWKRIYIEDESHDILFHKKGIHRYERGHIAYAASAPNSRKTHVFVALRAMNWKGEGPEAYETPFAKVIYGMKSLGRVNKDHGMGPDVERIWING